MASHPNYLLQFRRVGKGALCAVPTLFSCLAMVGTLRFAHPTVPEVFAISMQISPQARNIGHQRELPRQKFFPRNFLH